MKGKTTFDTFIQENIEKFNKEDFPTFIDFWTTKVEPILRSIGVPSDPTVASVYLPQEFQKAFFIGWGSGERHPNIVMDVLYNGWRKELEEMGRITRHEQAQKFRSYMQAVNPDTVSAERKFIIDGVMKRVQEKVSQYQAEKERKAELRRNTRVVRLNVSDINLLLGMLDEYSPSEERRRIRDVLSKALDRKST